MARKKLKRWQIFGLKLHYVFFFSQPARGFDKKYPVFQTAACYIISILLDTNVILLLGEKDFCFFFIMSDPFWKDWTATSKFKNQTIRHLSLLLLLFETYRVDWDVYNDSCLPNKTINYGITSKANSRRWLTFLSLWVKHMGKRGSVCWWMCITSLEG